MELTAHWKFAMVSLIIAVMATGCAENPRVMSLTVSGAQAESRVWPAPPDVPRYRYVGELTGEDNFHSEGWANRSTAAKFIDWLVGLTNQSEVPVVLQRPQSGMVDREGRIYVTDIGRGAVYVFNKPAGKLEVWEFAGENERFVAPIGIAPVNQEEILVADAELHTVIRLNSKGEPVGEFGREVLKRPTGLTRDSKRGVTYVADTRAHDIKVFGSDGKLQRVIGERGEGDGQFNFPTHLTFARDKLYVTDTLNSRIQVFDTQGKMISKFGKRGLFVGDLVRPKGVAVDSADNIYVIESLHDNLLVFDSSGRTLLAIGGSGKSAGEFYLPAGVWTDNLDQVYIADMFNGRIMILQFLGSMQ